MIRKECAWPPWDSRKPENQNSRALKDPPSKAPIAADTNYSNSQKGLVQSLGVSVEKQLK